MPSFTKLQECGARRICQGGIEGNNLHAGAANQLVEFGPGQSVGGTPSQYHTGLQQIQGREETAISSGDDPQEFVGLRFAPQDGDQRRTVDNNQTGNPWSS